jgi:uncharacterized protein
MPQTRDLAADIEALDEFLESDESPPDSMMLCDLDGFLTGIAVGPERIPLDEWLPIVWGEDTKSVFKNEEKAHDVLGTILKRYHQILGEVTQGAPAPIFMETPGGDIIASDWAEGFMQAVALRPEMWEPLLKPDKGSTLILPILALCCDEYGDSLLGLSQEVEDGFFEMAGQLVPAAIIAIAEYWHGEKTAYPHDQRNLKIGRNEPCPCGSGKKHKKCCGTVN